MKSIRAVVIGSAMAVAAIGMVLAQDKSAQKAQSNSVAPPEARPSVSATNAVPSSDYPVIGYIEKRDRTITIKAGPKGTLYSVKSSDGKILCEDLSAEQLHAQAPELHEFIKTAVAGGSGKGGGAVDARIRPTAEVR